MNDFINALKQGDLEKIKPSIPLICMGTNWLSPSAGFIGAVLTLQLTPMQWFENQIGKE